MPDKFSVDRVREYWSQQALKHGQSHEASWSDKMAIEMEIREIVRHLADGDDVLDVGCANGYKTVQFASQKRIVIRGVDASPEMVTEACSRASGLDHELLGEIDFRGGDIVALDEPAAGYDKVIVTRVLINLVEWDQQLKGLLECIRVLRSGGLILLSEATLQGWRRLNKLRREWGLSDIPMPPFNQYLDQEHVVEAMFPHARLVEIVDFASTYYVGTRVIKPLLIDALGADMDVADPETEWNRWCSQLPAWGDYGTQKLFVFQKR